MTRLVFTEMQEAAYTEPLVEASAAKETVYFRDLGYFGVGLTVNK
jgi:hypothetical protein